MQIKHFLKKNKIYFVLRDKYYNLMVKKEYKRVGNLPEQEYEEYLCDRYKQMMNRAERTKGLQMDFENPVTYTQKQQWMKLYDVTDTMKKCSDKYEVREYIKNELGEEYLIPLLTINGKDHFGNANEIDFNKLPDKFVLKCNHGSHYNIIVKDKESLSKIEIYKIKKQLNKWLKEKYEFKVGMELYYQGITPYIIVEKYMEINDDLPDYKFYCFNGEVKFLLCMQGRNKSLKQTIFDKDYKKSHFTIPTGTRIDYDDVTLEKPQNYDEMIRIAEKLSKPFKHVRVDLYNINGKIYFGELTFCNASGYDVAYPDEYDKIIGSYIDLDQTIRESNHRYRKF